LLLCFSIYIVFAVTCMTKHLFHSTVWQDCIYKYIQILQTSTKVTYENNTIKVRIVKVGIITIVRIAKYVGNLVEEML